MTGQKIRGELVAMSLYEYCALTEADPAATFIAICRGVALPYAVRVAPRGDVTRAEVVVLAADIDAMKEDVRQRRAEQADVAQIGAAADRQRAVERAEAERLATEQWNERQAAHQRNRERYAAASGAKAI